MRVGKAIDSGAKVIEHAGGRIEEMRWTRVPFGRHKGKTLPEIIVRDLDWFFWALPNLYGRLAYEAQELARKVRAIKVPKSDKGKLEVEYQYESDERFCGFSFVRADSRQYNRWTRGGRISICRGHFAEKSMTSEQAAS